MNKEKIQRINELAKLSKERQLTVSEAEEQQALRKEYIEEFYEKKQFYCRNAWH